MSWKMLDQIIHFPSCLLIILSDHRINGTNHSLHEHFSICFNSDASYEQNVSLCVSLLSLYIWYSPLNDCSK